MVYRIEHVHSLQAKLQAVVEGPDNVVYYIMHVKYGATSWSVSRRYSDFHHIWMALREHWDEENKCDCHDDIAIEMVSFPKKKVFHPTSVTMSRYESFRGFLKFIMILLQDELIDIANTCPIANKLKRFLMVDKLCEGNGHTFSVLDCSILYQDSSTKLCPNVVLPSNDI